MQSTLGFCALMVAAALGLIGGCSEETRQARGFALPEGDPDAGKATFVRLQCQQCHTVEGLSLPGEAAPGREISVSLGGDVTRVRTYGDLVTSIINPSHRIVYDPQQALADDGVSRMRVYNDVMTVRELVDLVAFLQPRYEVVPPPQVYAPYYEQ